MAFTQNAINNQCVSSITGTANQVIASAATGSVILSLPQSIGTANSPQFATLGLGVAATSNIILYMAASIGGATSADAAFLNPTFLSAVTNVAYMLELQPVTQAAAFTMNQLNGIYMRGATIGAGSAITTQQGFVVDNAMTTATNNRGFVGNLAASANNYNIYMAGTAQNLLAGQTIIGNLTTPSAQLHVVQGTLGSAVEIIASTATTQNPSRTTYQGRVATTDATQTTALTLTIPASTTYMVDIYVTARRTGGTSGTAEDGSGYIIRGIYKNVAGTATAIASAVVTIIGKSVGTTDATLSVSGATILVRVTGVATTNYTWHVTADTYQTNA